MSTYGKFKFFLFAAVFIFLYFTVTGKSFTVSASVSKSRTFNYNAKDVMSLIEDLTVFSRHFPNMISVTSLGNEKSEWVYEIDPPMASSFNVSFILYKKSPDDEQVVFESSKNDDNYFYCKAKFIPAGDERTVLSLYFKIRLTRESGSDIHFMAPLLGEKYISDKMKKDLSEDTDTFLNRIKGELRKKYGK